MEGENSAQGDRPEDVKPVAEVVPFWKRLVQEKIFWIGVTVVLTAIVVVIGWLIYDAAEERRVEANAVIISEDLVVLFGKEVRVSDFVKAGEGTKLQEAIIDTGKLGEMTVKFAYKNARGRSHVRDLTLEVVDKTAPKIYGGNYYTVYVGYEGDLTDLMMSGDNADDSPRREIVGEYDVNKVGSYDLEYVVTDASDNETRKNFTLNVVKPVISSEVPEPVEMPKLEIAEVIREHKNEETKIGIDVSQWQGEIDWEKVKDAGVEFAMIRVGYQNGDGGEYVLDPYFRVNVEGATKVGLPVGIYFYSYADSVEEAQRQAEWVLGQIDGYEMELGVAFDCEDWGNFNKAGMSFYTINKVAKKFISTIVTAGYRGMLYGSKVYLERIWETSQYFVWLAQYYDYVTYEGKYKMWQMNNTGRVEGIYGDVDIDIMYLK